MTRSTVAIGLAAVAVAVVVAVLATRFGTDPTEVESPLVGTPAPDVALPYLEGDGTLDLAAAEGEILVVNFWASWCIPCRAEHPVLLEAADRWADAGVRVVGIVYQDDVDSATGFLDELGRGYDVVTDPGGRAAISFGVFGIPETFFVDRDGTVVGNIRGPVDSGLLVGALDTILAGGDVGSIDSGEVQGTPD